MDWTWVSCVVGGLLYFRWIPTEPPGKPKALKKNQFNSVKFLLNWFLHLTIDYQFSSVTQSCLTLCDPVDCSTPGFLVHHNSGAGDAIQQSHPLSSSSPSAFHVSQHQDLFKWVSSVHQLAKLLKFQLQHQFSGSQTTFFVKASLSHFCLFSSL